MENAGKIKRVILCKHGEVALKGANRPQFEQTMMKDLRRRAKRVGNFEIYAAQSTVYIEPCGEDDDIDEMYRTHRFRRMSILLNGTQGSNSRASYYGSSYYTNEF